jgi:hypothetical protein
MAASIVLQIPCGVRIMEVVVRFRLLHGKSDGSPFCRVGSESKLKKTFELK